MTALLHCQESCTHGWCYGTNDWRRSDGTETFWPFESLCSAMSSRSNFGSGAASAGRGSPWRSGPPMQLVHELRAAHPLEMQSSSDRRQASPSTRGHCAYLWVHFLKQISYQFPYPSLLNDLSCLSIWPHSAIFCTALDTSSCHQDLLEQPTKHNARASWILQQNPSIAGATSCHMTVVSQQASV